MFSLWVALDSTTHPWPMPLHCTCWFPLMERLPFRWLVIKEPSFLRTFGCQAAPTLQLDFSIIVTSWECWERFILLLWLEVLSFFPTGFEKLWGGIKPCLSFCHVLPASLGSCVKVYMFAILSWESADVQCQLTLLMNFWQLWSPLAPVLFKSQMDFPRWKRTCSWPHLGPRKLVLNQAHSLCLIWSLWFHPIRCLNSQFFSFLIPMYTWHQKLDKWLQIRWEKNKTLFLKQNLILF